jgi:hypothetical protein
MIEVLHLPACSAEESAVCCITRHGIMMHVGVFCGK